jgi:PiT family inorganic phosphate transporter
MGATAAGAALAAGFALAAMNGANDTSKGVATLVGARVTSLERALAWGLAWTALGGLLGAALAGGLVATFGRGLLGPGVEMGAADALAAIAGAAAWVALATRFGLPVSTTHGIVGSVAGAATAAHGLGGFAWATALRSVAVPLLIGPLVAFGLAAALARALPPLPEAASDGLHWATSAGVSAARAMNDVPKIAALVLGATAVAAPGSLSDAAVFAVVVSGMLTGGWLGGRRVTRLLAHDVVALEHRGGLIANAVAAVLVGLGALGSLPLSTTHVASGGIVGAAPGRADRRVLREIAAAWIVTAPTAALLGAACSLLLRSVA